jgi:hypothetical protein
VARRGSDFGNYRREVAKAIKACSIDQLYAQRDKRSGAMRGGCFFPPPHFSASGKEYRDGNKTIAN